MRELKATIAEQELTFTPLNLDDCQLFEDMLKEIETGKITGMATIMAFIPFISKSVAKHHPDLTDAQLRKVLSVPDIEPAQRALLTVSGFKLPEKQTGETPPAAESIGPTSTAA